MDRNFDYLIEMASVIYRLSLYLPVADQNEDKRPLFHFFLNESIDKVKYLGNRVSGLLEHYGEDIGSIKEKFVNN